MKKVDLSIIIINYNTNTLTCDCIQSVYKSVDRANLSIEIIVVDNASPDEDPQEIVNLYPEVLLLKSSENLGFGRANNLGIEKSSGGYILLLNSDTIVLEDCLPKSLDFIRSSFAREEMIGLLGCHVFNEDRTDQVSTFGKHLPYKYFLTSNGILSRFVKSELAFDFTKSQFVTGVSGCFMLFDRKVFSELKAFDPDFFMYSEETELCRNRIDKKFKTYYFADASIVHLGGGSADKTGPLYQNMLSFALYRYKFGLFDYSLFILSTIINIATNIFLVPFYCVFGKKGPGKELIGYLKILPYLFFDIPLYPSKWGGREKPLKF